MLTKVLGVTGFVLLAVGALLTFRPVTVAGVSCGSVFQPMTGITPMACDQQLDGRARSVAVLGVVGFAAAAASTGIVTVRDRKVRQRY